MTSYAERLSEHLGAVRQLLDEAHAAGLPVAPVAAVGLANLGVAVFVMAGAEGAEADVPAPAQLAAALTGGPCPPAQTEALRSFVGAQRGKACDATCTTDCGRCKGGAQRLRIASR